MAERIPTVLELIIERKVRGSKPGKRDDGWWMVYAPDSGGKRGVVAGGGSTALEKLGLVDSFDEIEAVSCGVCAGNYLVAGQAVIGTRIYYEKINNVNFNNLVRIPRGLPALNMRFLTHEVMWSDEESKLDASRVLSSAIPVRAYAADALSVETFQLPEPRDRVDVHDNMWLACSIPGLTDSPHDYGGRFITDAGILVGGMPVKQVLMKQAVKKCTHLLAMRSRSEDGVSVMEKLGETIVINWISRQMRERGFNDLARAVLAVERRQAEGLILLDRHSQNVDILPQVKVVRLPKGSRSVPILEKSRSVLRGGAITGYNSMVGEFEPYILAGVLRRPEPANDIF